MTEPEQVLDIGLAEITTSKRDFDLDRIGTDLDGTMDSSDLNREDALKRRRSMSVKKFDLVVPSPISTSTRSFSSSRPTSMSFSMAPVTSSVSSGEGGSRKWVVNVPTPLAGFSSSPSKLPRPMKLDIPPSSASLFGSSKSTGTSPLPSDSMSEPRFPSFGGSSASSSDDSASPLASAKPTRISTSGALSGSPDASDASLVSSADGQKDASEESNTKLGPNAPTGSNNSSTTLANDSDDINKQVSPRKEHHQHRHKHKDKKSSRHSRKSTSELDSDLSHSRISSLNGHSNTEDESSVSTSTATPQRFDSPSKLARTSSSTYEAGNGLSYSGEESTLIDALVSPRYRPPVPTKSAAMLERRKEKQASIASSSSSVGSSHTSNPSSSGDRPSTPVASKPPIPKRTSAYFDSSAYKLGARSKLNVDGEGNGEDSSAPLSVEERNKLRANLALELSKTEAFYVKSLQTIVSSYLQPMRASLSTVDPILPAEQQKLLFSNVEVLLGIHQSFAVTLDKIISEWSPTSLLGSALQQLTPFLKIYTQYINNYNQSMHVYQDAMKHKSFRRFIAEASVGNDLDNWPSYCIQPVQRIPKYLLILNELLKNTPEDHPDFQGLKTALDSLTSMANEINTHKRDAENLTHCAQIQSMVTYPEGVAKIELVTQTRRFCRQGNFDVFINGISSPFNHLVLFNDAVLIAKSKKKTLRFDGFLNLAHTVVSTNFEEFADDELTASSSATSDISMPSPSSLNLGSMITSSTASSSSAPTSTTPPPAISSHTLVFRSLVIGATVIVKFPNAEELAVWRADSLPGSAKPDAVMPDNFSDRIVSVELATASTEEPLSPRKSSQSLGSSRSKHKLRRLLTLGTGKSSKKDSTAHASLDLATENRTTASSSSSRVGHHKSATKDS